MTEQIFIALIVCSALVLGVFTIGLFASGHGKSNFETLVESWRDKRIAEVEVEKLKAQHERVCPRLTDKPRGT